MLVAADWQPHVYTNDELDQIEKAHSGTLEDFSAVICRQLRKISEKEKFDFRCGVRKAFRMKIPAPKIGDTVTVELFSGHIICGVVKAICDSVSGKRFKVSAGDAIVEAEEGQIVVQ